MKAPGGSGWGAWVVGKVIPLAFWSLLLATEGWAVFRQGARFASEGFRGALALDLIRHSLTLGFFLLVLAAYLARRQRVARAEGFRERVFPMALFLAGPTGIALLHQAGTPRQFDASWGGVLVAVPGLCLSLWALWHLRGSFSILAEARRLVTSGPYRYIRHPLYLGEAVTMLGLCLLIGTVAALLFWAGINAFQLVRAGIEENKLAREFAEYRAYRQKTRFILPGIY